MFFLFLSDSCQGPIVNLPLLVVTASFGSSSRGLRRLILGTALAAFLAGVLRLIPIWFDDSLASHSIYFLNIAQILNAGSGPPIQATVSRFSSIWMGSTERTFTTALLFVSNVVGSTLGFVIGPAVVKEPSDMPKYLYIQAGLATFAFLLIMAYFPHAPPTFPSKAAQQMAMNEAAEEAAAAAAAASSSTSVLTPLSAPFLAPVTEESIMPTKSPSTIRAIFSNRSLLLLTIATGFQAGIYACWIGVLSTVLPFSDSTCGWLSFAGSLMVSLGGLAIGPVAVKWNRQLRRIILILSAITIIFAGWFLMSTESIFQHDPIIPESNVYLMGVTLGITGFMVGATSPLAFEFGAELTYPIPESLSGGCFIFVQNASGLIFLFVAPHVSGAVMTAIMFGTMVMCTVLIIPIKERYGRMDAEDGIITINDNNDNSSILSSTDLSHSGSVSIIDYAQYSNGRVISSLSRVSAQAEMQREFARVMKEVDEGMNEALREDQPIHHIDDLNTSIQ